MNVSRRDIIKLALAGAAHPLLPVRGIVSQAFAAPGAGDTKFLLVFLRGGYDAANVVIPIGSDFYYESRPTLAIPRPDPRNPQSALSLARSGDAANWGLHPALKDTILPLWQKGQIAFVPFAGSEDLTRSHFETQDSLESGLPIATTGAPPPAYGSGFLNRLAASLDGTAAPVSFTDGLPRVMTGPILIPNVSLKGPGRAPFDERQMGLLSELYAGTRFEPLIAEGFDLRRTVAETSGMLDAAPPRSGPGLGPNGPQTAPAGAPPRAPEGMAPPPPNEMAPGMAGASPGLAAEMVAANRNAITARGFELEARRMALLMRDKFNVAFIDVGGWDTHVNQGGAQGQLASLLTSLGQGVAGFAEEMGPAWKRTVVVVLSEFGRTFRENGTRGTDHGHGSVYWVLGGALQGGRFAGEEVVVSPQTLNQNRDFPVMTEYRALLGGIFKRMYSLDASRLERVFPNTIARDIGLI